MAKSWWVLFKPKDSEDLVAPINVRFNNYTAASKYASLQARDATIDSGSVIITEQNPNHIYKNLKIGDKGGLTYKPRSERIFS